MAKITPFGMKVAIDTHLGGTRIHSLLAQVVPQLKVDEAGSVLPEQIENLRKMFRVVAPMAPDDVVRVKCETMLSFLEQF